MYNKVTHEEITALQGRVEDIRTRMRAAGDTGNVTLLAAVKYATPEQIDALIEDVRTYYTAHPEKPFPGWPAAVAQFERNQKRWGKTSAPRGSLQSMQEILNRVVPED